jgi:hypothetical protein
MKFLINKSGRGKGRGEEKREVGGKRKEGDG